MGSEGQYALVPSSKLRSVCQTETSSASVSEKAHMASPLTLPFPDPLSSQKVLTAQAYPSPTISPVGLRGGHVFFVPPRRAFRGGAV